VSSALAEPRSLRRLLADISLLGTEYDGYVPPSTAEILERARRARAERAAARTAHPAPGALAGRSESEQARHELNLAATLVLHQRSATGDLAELTTQPYLDPVGALVLASLLQVSGRHLAARFWFKFAAGGGHPDAAYCLYLAHRAEGEFHDAENWRRQAARLRLESAAPRPPAQQGPHLRVGAPPRLAREVRSLLAQCYRGGNPQVSSAIETTIERLGITDADEFPGSDPRPAGELIEALVPSS
jgi:hypothetical protein